MTLRMAWRSLVAQPVRTAVLVIGFGAGIAAMAGLLGVGDVILEQSRAPELRGGGDLVIVGMAGPVTSARFLLSQVLTTPPLDGRVAVASPSSETSLYLVEAGQRAERITVRGGIPSLERALPDGETSAIAAWQDVQEDSFWSAPEPGDVLRALDRFHPIPDVPERADSWAEWLYFNGKTDDAGFYLTFFVGPSTSPGRRFAGVRLQLERDGRLTNYAAGEEIDAAALLETAPDLTVDACRVRLEGNRYVIDLELYEEERLRAQDSPQETDLQARLVMNPVAGRALPPLKVEGADGWVSGYVVPVSSGTLEGSVRVAGETLSFDGARGYHDHNWGFWEGVTWQWGQVESDDVSLVYGRIRPPEDVADPDRMPGFLMALGPEGPLGYAVAISIDEEDDPLADHPKAIRVVGQSASLDLTLDLEVHGAERTPFGGPFRDRSRPLLELVQMRASFRVNGTIGDRTLSFTAAGSAETFRGK